MRRHQILHKNSGLVATQYYEKNSGLSALFQYAPIYGHVNADYVILFKKNKPGNNSGANYPRDIKFCTGTQVCVATQPDYEKNSGLSALFQYARGFTAMLTQTMFFI